MESAAPARLLKETDVARILERTLRSRFAHGDRVLVIIPDGTRTAPIPLVFRQICDLLLERVAALDFLVALGTHAPMSESALLAHVGISRSERAGKYSRVGLFNHAWDDPSALVTLETISAEEVYAITQGLIKRRASRDGKP